MPAGESTSRASASAKLRSTPTRGTSPDTADGGSPKYQRPTSPSAVLVRYDTACATVAAASAVLASYRSGHATTRACCPAQWYTPTKPGAAGSAIASETA